MALHSYTQYQRIGVADAKSRTTGDEGVVVFSDDAKVYWLFTKPDELHQLAQIIEKAAVKLVHQKRGAKLLSARHEQIVSKFLN